MTRAVRAAPTRRPRDRRTQLATIAADLFRRHGYHNVGVDDIAAAAGITGPAVYRHFRSKQAILADVVLAGVDDFTRLVDGALDRQPDHSEIQAATGRRLSDLTAALAPFFLERREVHVLWVRERRNLDPAEHDELRMRLARPMVRWTEQLRVERPELSTMDANLLCWAALSVLGSPAHHHIHLSKARFEGLLRDLADTVLSSEAVLHSQGSGAGLPEAAMASGPGFGMAMRSSRREQLLVAAARLFRERGFHATSMEDIGAAAGIAGPSVYRHFASKQELLMASCVRMADRLRIGAEAALGEAAGPREAIEGVIRSYVATARDNSDLIAVYVSEGDNLSPRDQAELRRLQRTSRDELAHLLVTVRPELSQQEARVVLTAATTLVNDLVRMRRFRDRPRLVKELTELTLTVLGTVPAG